MLRAATARAHSDLEDVVGTLADMNGYARYARGLHAFRASLESPLTEMAAAHFATWRPTAIAQALADDLTDLNLAALSPPSMMIQDMAHALGALYVLEGSALGARALVKQVEALGLGPTFGARHLWRQAASLESWRQFVTELENAAFDLDAAVAGANAAFRLAQDCMMQAADG